MYAYLFTHLLGGEAHFWDEMLFVSLELEDRISLASRPGNGRRSHRTLEKKTIKWQLHHLHDAIHQRSRKAWWN